MAVKKVYVVAPKVTILINGITYKSGSVIKPEYFADKAVWTKFIQKKKIITKEEYEKLTGKTLTLAAEALASEDESELETKSDGAEATIDTSSKDVKEE